MDETESKPAIDPENRLNEGNQSDKLNQSDSQSGTVGSQEENNVDFKTV